MRQSYDELHVRSLRERERFWAEAADSISMRARLGAVYSSDAGHFDLPDMRKAAAEAYELVEDGLITEDDFRDFAFTNPVRAKTDLNPDFFRGTRVEDDVARLLRDAFCSFRSSSATHKA